MTRTFHRHLFLFSALILLGACAKDEDRRNPCDDIDCGDGGHCVDGHCVYSELWLNDVQVTKFPGTNSAGHDWDSAGKADIFIRLVKFPGSIPVWESSAIIDADSNSIYTFQPGSPLSIQYSHQHPSDLTYTIQLNDDDSPSPNTFMEELIVYPSTWLYYGYAGGNSSGNYTDTISSTRFEVLMHYTFIHN